MSFMRLAACTAVLVALSAGCASAEPALATANVNVRQGPGTTYQIITTIPGGSTVDVNGCSGQWCQVTWQGRQGYAIATALDTGRGSPGAAGGPVGQGGPPPGAVPGDDVPVPAYGPGPPPPAVVVVPGPYYYGGPYYGYGWRGGYYRGGYGYRYGYRGYRRW